MHNVNSLRLKEIKVLYILKKNYELLLYLRLSIINLQFFLECLILWGEFLYFEFTLQCFLFKLLFFIHSFFLCLFHMNIHSIILLSHGIHQYLKFKFIKTILSDGLKKY